MKNENSNKIIEGAYFPLDMRKVWIIKIPDMYRGLEKQVKKEIIKECIMQLEEELKSFLELETRKEKFIKKANKYLNEK